LYLIQLSEWRLKKIDNVLIISDLGESSFGSGIVISLLLPRGNEENHK
jgi:hypothetical protein